MAFKLLDRVRMSLIGTPGTGAMTLNLAAAGFQDFVTAGMSDGDTTSYLIEDGAPFGSVWEIGVGTYHSNGTFTRDTVTQSSAGGTTKIAATSSAVLSATLRAEDLNAAPRYIGGATNAPVVVQHTLFTSDGSGNATATFTNAVTQGNLLLFIGAAPDSDGSHGFNVTSADFQFNQNNTTAWKVGWAYHTVVYNDTLAAPHIVSCGSSVAGNVVGIALEISGATIAALQSTMWANGTLTGSPSSVSAFAPANSLEIVMGVGAATITLTVPASFQNSYAAHKSGWQATPSDTTNTLTGTCSGSNGAFVIAIPGH